MLPQPLKIATKSNRRKQPPKTNEPASHLPKDYGNLLVIVAVKVESYYFFFKLAQVLFDVALDVRYIFLVDYDVFRIYKFGRLECIGKCLAGIVFRVGVERRVKGNVGVER